MARGDAFNKCMVIRVKEKGYGVSVLGAAVDYSVWSRPIDVVGPASHKLA